MGLFCPSLRLRAKGALRAELSADADLQESLLSYFEHLKHTPIDGQVRTNPIYQPDR